MCSELVEGVSASQRGKFMLIVQVVVAVVAVVVVVMVVLLVVLVVVVAVVAFTGPISGSTRLLLHLRM